MKIPAEALSIYRPERTVALIDPRAAQPVGEAVRIGATLPKLLPQATLAPPEAARAERRRPVDDERKSAQDARRGERRKSKQQVLIDTRVAGRRRADENATIDVSV